MGLEDLTGTKFIDSLDSGNPVGATDFLSAADDHMRGIKNILKQTFPNLAAAANMTAAEMNLLIGLTALLSKDVADTKTGILTLVDVLTMQSNYLETNQSVGLGGAIGIDTDDASYFYTGVLTSIPVFTFNDAPAASRVRSFTIELNNAANYLPDWSANTIEWAGNGTEPTWSAGKDIVSFVTREAGNPWLGFPGGIDFA